jgi:hypothetical protein
MTSDEDLYQQDLQQKLQQQRLEDEQRAQLQQQEDEAPDVSPEQAPQIPVDEQPCADQSLVSEYFSNTDDYYKTYRIKQYANNVVKISRPNNGEMVSSLVIDKTTNNIEQNLSAKLADSEISDSAKIFITALLKIRINNPSKPLTLTFGAADFIETQKYAQALCKALDADPGNKPSVITINSARSFTAEQKQALADIFSAPAQDATARISPAKI